MGTIVETYLRLTPEEEARFNAEMAMDVNKEVRQMVLTWEEAMAESEAKGEARGETRATRQAIVLLLKHKWGSVSEDLVAKLDALGDLAHFYEILEQAVDAHSVDDLDLEPRPRS